MKHFAIVLSWILGNPPETIIVFRLALQID